MKTIKLLLLSSLLTFSLGCAHHGKKCGEQCDMKNKEKCAKHCDMKKKKDCGKQCDMKKKGKKKS